MAHRSKPGMSGQRDHGGPLFRPGEKAGDVAAAVFAVGDDRIGNGDRPGGHGVPVAAANRGAAFRMDVVGKVVNSHDIGTAFAGGKKIAGPVKKIIAAASQFSRKKSVFVQKAGGPGLLGKAPSPGPEVWSRKGVVAQILAGAVYGELVGAALAQHGFKKRVNVLADPAFGGPYLKGVDCDPHEVQPCGPRIPRQDKTGENVPHIVTQEISITLHSEDETRAAAEALAHVLRGGDHVSLEGPLGAGKTFFVRAVARALGVKEHVASPTFVLQRIYHAAPNLPVRQLLHYDLYRLESPEELYDIGFGDCPPDAVVLAEWGDRFPEELPSHAIRVCFEPAGETLRRTRFLMTDADQASALQQELIRKGMVEKE